jgi:hypothetical protein
MTRTQLVLGRDDESVKYVEYSPSSELSVDDLTELLGEGRDAPLGPHEVAPTVIFDDLWPDSSPRGCTVMARLPEPQAPAPSPR